MSASLPKALSILLVEDSPTDGRLLLEALRPAVSVGEVVVQTVRGLNAAIEALKSFDFSCVLLDLGLPDGKGTGNVTALREVDRKTAIIVLTGLADEKLAAEALALGAQDYLIKGESDGVQLLRQLRRAVQRNRQLFEIQLRHDQAFFEASHDALTRLPNTALLLDRARQQLAGARESGGLFALACLHIGDFSRLRQQAGAQQANDLLCSVAERWHEGLRAGDTLAHLGNGEFALLRHPVGAMGEWRELIAQCSAQLGLLCRQADWPALSLRDAVTLASTETTSVDALLATATQQAREQNDASVPQTRTTPPTLPTAAPDGSLLWQPWVDLATQRCLGVELITTTAGTTADEVATETLRAAEQLVQQGLIWAAEQCHPPLMSIKVPALAFAAQGFADALASTLAQALAPTCVQLAIGEAVFRELPLHLAALAKFRRLGLRLVLDGDGSKDISLHDFAACALDGYKLSPALLRTLMDENMQGSARRIVSAILGAAQQLGATVIATGADNEAQLAVLRLVGVRNAQGDGISVPVTAEHIPALLAKPLASRARA